MALDHIRNEFDVCIIDNSPYTNSLTYNTMNACCKEGDIILIPTKIDNYSIVGLSKTVHMMMEWLQAMPLGFDFKILLTMVNRNKTEKCMVEQIDGEIEVTKIEESNDQKTCTVCYLMPYSEIQNTYSFDIDSEVQDAIDGFCAKVKERAHEMIFHINECANSVEDYFNMEE